MTAENTTRRRPCIRDCGRIIVNPNGVCRTCKREEHHERLRREIIQQILAYEHEHRQVPALRDVPLGRRARSVFGSWVAAVEAAGLTAWEPGHKKLPPRIPMRDRVPLSGWGGVKGYALVDPGDYDRLCGQHWNLGTDGYAYGRISGRQTAMHRVILGLVKGDGVDVDHINGNRLDNRRSNLRTCTRSENLQNRTAPVTGGSRFRGVFYDGSRWVARASRNNRAIHIGRFATEMEAAIAAQEWRSEHMPFAQPDPELVAALAERQAAA